MSDDRLQLGIHTEVGRALCGDVNAAALLSELARLYVKCGEPLGWQLDHYAPTGYEQLISSEKLATWRAEYDADEMRNMLRIVRGKLASGRAVGNDWQQAALDAENFIIELLGPQLYVQTQRNEIIRESCPRIGPDDGPDTDEDA
jgi:hypothetical protein